MANKTVDQLTTFSGSMADDDLLPIFDTSESADEKLKGISVEDLKTDLNFPSMDPSALGNWVLIKEGTFDGEIITGMGTQDVENNTHYKYVAHGSFDGDGLWKIPLGGISSGWNNVGGFTDAAYGGTPTSGNICRGEWIISPFNNGKQKLVSGWHWRNGSAVEHIHGYNSTTTFPTSISIYEWDGSNHNFTGTISLYKWQEVKPIELHSYELVKEYNLDNETLDDTIDWDGEADSELHITANLLGGGVCYIRPNGDDGASNYTYGGLHQNGAVASANSGSTSSFTIGASSADQDVNQRWHINLKNTGYSRLGNRLDSMINSTDTDKLLSTWAWRWDNVVDDVTSITIDSNSVAVTGTIKFFKLAKTHLFNQTIYNHKTLNVATTGSDTTGDGTSQKPFASIKGAFVWLRNKTLNSNARVTIQLADGTYNNQEYISNNHISNDIRIEGNSSTPANVVLNFATGQTGLKTFKNSYLTLAGFTMNGFSKAEWKTGVQAQFSGTIVMSDMVLDGWGVGAQAFRNGFLSADDCTVNDCNYGIHAISQSRIYFENGALTNNSSYGTLTERQGRIVTYGTTYTSNGTDNQNGTGGLTEVM